MGTDIDGWIEYRDVDINDEVWYPAMKLGVVYLGRDYKTFDYFFGIKRWDLRHEPKQVDDQPIAAKRGLPDDISPQVKNDAAHSGLYAHTWITWHEMKESNWKRDISWDATIRVFEVLASLYGDKNVRYVVWFED